MPGCGVISTTSDTFSPDAMAAVTGGVLIAACFESGWAPRNWSDGAFWATTAVEEHRSASKTVRMELIVQSVGVGLVAKSVSESSTRKKQRAQRKRATEDTKTRRN